MNLFLIIPLALVAFVLVVISICIIKTFEIERYIHSKIESSSVFDILNMSYDERTIGLGENNFQDKQRKNQHITIDMSLSKTIVIKISKTVKTEKDWKAICEMNICQAKEYGFNEKSSTNKLEYHCNNTWVEKSLNCTEDSITLNIKGEISRLVSCNFSSYEFHSVIPLIDSFKNFKELAKK